MQKTQQASDPHSNTAVAILFASPSIQCSDTMVNSILVPTDGSEHSQRATEQAIELAQPLNAAIHGLSIASEYGFDERQDQLRSDPADPAQEAISQMKETVQTADLEFTGGIRDGRPHKQILTYAEENDIDLIVMGSKGRTGVERVVIGSVAEKTLRNAEIPVLTVPSPAE